MSQTLQESLPVGTKVTMVKSGDIIEIAPGKRMADQVPRADIARFGFVSLCRLPDGNYMPVLKTWGQTVRLTSDLFRDLGLDVSYDTVRRLINGGFLRVRRIAPNSIVLELESLYDHLEAVRDPEFWTEARIKAYREPVW